MLKAASGRAIAARARRAPTEPPREPERRGGAGGALAGRRRRPRLRSLVATPSAWTPRLGPRPTAPRRTGLQRPRSAAGRDHRQRCIDSVPKPGQRRHGPRSRRRRRSRTASRRASGRPSSARRARRSAVRRSRRGRQLPAVSTTTPARIAARSSDWRSAGEPTAMRPTATKPTRSADTNRRMARPPRSCRGASGWRVSAACCGQAQDGGCACATWLDDRSLAVQAVDPLRLRDPQNVRSGASFAGQLRRAETRASALRRPAPRLLPRAP